MRDKIILLLLVIQVQFGFCQTISSTGDQYCSNLEHYNVDNGLSHNQINWIHKDRRGMMWIGTFNGINRYDGQEFKYVAEVDFVHVNNHKYMIEDEDGDLWLVNGRHQQELFFFNTITEQVKTFEEKFGSNPPFKKEEYHYAKMLADKTIIVFTKTGNSFRYNSDGSLSKNQLTKASGWSYPNSNKYWLAKSDDIIYANENDEVIHHFKNVPPLLKEIGVNSKNHLFYHGEDIYIYELTPEGQIIQHDSKRKNLSRFNVTTFYFSNQKEEGFIQIANGKFEIYNVNNTKTSVFSQYFKELSVTNISTFLKDGDNYWVGTVNGLLKIQAKPSYFKKGLYKNPKMQAQVNFKSCRGMLEDEYGNVFVSTIDDVLLLNVKNGEPYNQAWEHYSYHNTLMTDDGILWTNDGFHNLRGNTNTNQLDFFETEGMIHSEAWSFFQDSTKRIWGGTALGLTYYEEGFSKFKKYKKYNGFDELKNNITFQFFTDQEGILWLATSGGLYQFDVEEGIVARYWKGGKGEYSFPAEKIQHIHQDAEGIFWMACREGLLRWDKEKSTTQLFTNQDGLINNNLNALFEDEFGFIWMSSDNGIIQFQKATFKVKNYRSSDGITHPEFNRISHLQGSDGTIYFGGLNGVTYFHPRDFVESFDEPVDNPLVLTECKIFSEKSETQEDRLIDFYKNKKITLAPDDRYLTLQFALLDYKNLKKPQYVFEINGEKWEASKENTINISSLPYGDHILTVKGRTGNGLFSSQVLSIPIEVLRPFYLQWWFILSGITAFAFLIFILQKRKTQRLIERQEILEKTVSERTQTIQNQTEELRQLNKAKSKFMANISHEFRTPLTLILNTLSREKVQKILNVGNCSNGITYYEKDVDIMERNAQRLRQLIDQLLDLSKSEEGKMKLQASQGDFHQYLKSLVFSFKPFAKNKNITLTFSASLSSDENDLDKWNLYFDRDKMDKIIYNLLGNAIKFTPSNGKIEVQMQQLNEKIILKIKDSGIGIPKEELPLIFNRFYRGVHQDEYAYEGTGLGLALVKDFVEVHYGKIHVESEVGNGTSFIIHLPKGDAHLQSEEKIILPKNTPQPKQSKIENDDLKNNLILTQDKELPLLLIIEDNADLLYHHQQTFKNDYQLLLAKDGAEGIEMAIEHLPDVIVCDVMMPKKNGYEVCQHLKLDERTNHIPIILLTAKAGHSEKMEGLMVGADEYLTKPYDQSELKIRLKNLLEHQQLLRNKFAAQLKDSASPKNAIKTPQQLFIEKCKDIVEENLKNPNFGVNEWSNQLGMSRSQLFRKVKTVIGTTPTQFVRSYRLTKAKELLVQNAGNASEVSYMVGFNNPNYFFKCFKDEYGVTVGTFIKD